MGLANLFAMGALYLRIMHHERTAADYCTTVDVTSIRLTDRADTAASADGNAVGKAGQGLRQTSAKSAATSSPSSSDDAAAKSSSSSST